MCACISVDVGAIVGSHFGRPNDAVHLTNVGCFGDEMTLGACQITKLDIGDAQLYQTVAGVTCRAASFVLVSTSAASTSVSTSASATPKASQVSSSRTAVTNTIVVFAVVVVIAIVAAVM